MSVSLNLFKIPRSKDRQLACGILLKRISARVRKKRLGRLLTLDFIPLTTYKLSSLLAMYKTIIPYLPAACGKRRTHICFLLLLFLGITKAAGIFKLQRTDISHDASTWITLALGCILAFKQLLRRKRATMESNEHFDQGSGPYKGSYRLTYYSYISGKLLLCARL